MKTTIAVQNLKCGGCANTIISKLSELDDITTVKVDNDTSEVSFDYLNNDNLLKVEQKLLALGYPSVTDKNSMISKAKSFVSCASGRMSK